MYVALCPFTHGIAGYLISIESQLPEDDAKDGFGDSFLDIGMQCFLVLRVEGL